MNKIHFSERLDVTKERWRNMPEFDKVKMVNSMINFKRYKKDKKDTWLTPSEFLEHGGDCEDFAICKYYLLLDLGVPYEKLFLSYSKLDGISHMVLLYIDNDTYVLDNMKAQILTEDERDDLKLSWRFNNEFLYYKNHKRKNTMKKWLDMKSRLKYISA